MNYDVMNYDIWAGVWIYLIGLGIVVGVGMLLNRRRK